MNKVKDPFQVANEHLAPEEHEKRNIHRMAELILVGCKEKKSYGSNWKKIATKEKHIQLMKDIGFTHYKDTWISRSHTYMAMRILGWNDVKNKSINLYKMVIYGHLKWIVGMNTDLIKLILEYL